MSTPDASLFAKTARGAGWVVGFRLTTRLLGIVSTLVLVRLLGPGDFGLVALASSFTQIVEVLSNLSVHEAIVREKSPDRAMYDTAFTMNLIRGAITGGLVLAAVPWVADFFREPRLAPVLVALAASSVVGALENIATADFMREMNFRQEFRLWTIPRVLGTVCTITFAILWPTYWALVFGIVVGRVARTILSYGMYPYLPRLTLSAWRRIVGFTAWSWAIYVVQSIGEKSVTALIGRIFSPALVGIYALGGEIASLPTTELVEPMCRACFPSFSQLRNSGSNVGQAYLRVLSAAALLVLPAGAGIALVADPLIRLAFGPKWLEAIPMIQILGVTASINAIGSLGLTLFSAFGMLRVSFAITGTATVARLVALMLFVPGGTLVTAAKVMAAVAICEQATYIALTMHRFNVPVRLLIRAVWRCLLGVAVMTGGLIALGLGYTTEMDALFFRLVETSATGAAIYTAVVGIAWYLSGRPDGSERDLLNVLGGAIRPLRRLIATAARRGTARPRGAE